MTQQAVADLAGIPRNQVVRAERGDNITLDTLRKIAAHLPLTELTLLDTTGLRVDIIADPERLFLAAMENVLRLADAMRGAVELAMEARRSVELARRHASSMPEGYEPQPDIDPRFMLQGLDRLASELQRLRGEPRDEP
jgi:transcriptional regulator with XRE-family HTH domain